MTKASDNPKEALELIKKANYLVTVIENNMTTENRQKLEDDIVERYRKLRNVSAS